MPAVRFRHDRSQIIVKVAILPPALDPEPWRLATAPGLIDTGASVSGVSASIARELRLPRRGKEVITTPGGDYAARLFQFRVGIYLDDERSSPHVLDKEFVGIECAPGRDFEVLIGMDLLGRGDLQIRRDGTGTFAFDEA